MELMVRLQREIGSQKVEKLPAARNLISGSAIGIVIFIAAIFFRDTSTVVAVQLPVTGRFA